MDHGSRRWVTLAASVAAALCTGFCYAWSVFLKPMAAAEGWSSAEVTLSYTALMSTAAVMAIVSGWALKYLRPRTLVLLGGLFVGVGLVALGSVHALGAVYAFAFVAGIGIGLVYPGATMANLIRYFPDRGGFASGMLTAGAGVGGMLWGPVAVWLIDQYGMTWALRVLGVVFCAGVIVCSRLVSTAPDAYAPDGWTPSPARLAAGEAAPQKDWRHMLRSPLFYLLAALFLAGTTSGMLVIGQAALIVQDMAGASAQAAGIAVTAVALGMVLGKVLWGWLSDRIGRYAVLALLFAVAVVALLLMIGAGGYASLVTGMAAVASCYGGFVSLMGPVTADAFGSRHLGVNFGIMFLSVAVAAYVGPQLGARAAVVSGDFTAAFAVAALISAAGLLAAAGFFVALRRVQARENA